MIIIGRPINDVSINGLEYLLTADRKEYMKFTDVPAAREFVRENCFPGATDEELNNYFTFKEEE